MTRTAPIAAQVGVRGSDRYGNANGAVVDVSDFRIATPLARFFLAAAGFSMRWLERVI